MFFDIHTHAFHPKIAHKAVDHLNTVYHLDCRGDGTIEFYDSMIDTSITGRTVTVTDASSSVRPRPPRRSSRPTTTP